MFIFYKHLSSVNIVTVCLHMCVFAHFMCFYTFLCVFIHFCTFTHLCAFTHFCALHSFVCVCLHMFVLLHSFVSVCVCMCHAWTSFNGNLHSGLKNIIAIILIFNIFIPSWFYLTIKFLFLITQHWPIWPILKLYLECTRVHINLS